jgi:hypothetical protein
MILVYGIVLDHKISSVASMFVVLSNGVYYGLKSGIFIGVDVLFVRLGRKKLFN